MLWLTVYWNKENLCPVGFMSWWRQDLFSTYPSVDILFFFLWITPTAILRKKNYASLFSVFPFVSFQFGLICLWNFHVVEITAVSIALELHHIISLWLGPNLRHWPLYPGYTDLSSCWLIKLVPSSRCLPLTQSAFALCVVGSSSLSSLLLRGEFLKLLKHPSSCSSRHISVLSCFIAVFIMHVDPSSFILLGHKLLQWILQYTWPISYLGFVLCIFFLNKFSRTRSLDLHPKDYWNMVGMLPSKHCANLHYYQQNVFVSILFSFIINNTAYIT